MMALALRSVRRSLDEQAVRVNRSQPAEPHRAPLAAPPTKTQTRFPRTQHVDSPRGDRASFDLSLGRSGTLVEERCEGNANESTDVGAKSVPVWSEWATIAPLCIGISTVEEATGACAEVEASMVPKPSFVFVRPSKALDFTGEGATRVTSEVSMESVLARTGAEYETQVYEKAALAVRTDCEHPVCCSTSDTSMTIVFGKIENTDYLKRKHNLDGSCSQSEVVEQLVGIAKYGFLPALRGEFTLVHYDANEDQVFAASDAARTYGFKQGRDCTGGLLITDADLGSEYELSEVPAASFIFGKYRGRNIHKYASTVPEFEQTKTASVAAALRALSGLSTVCKPTTQTVASDRERVPTRPTRAETSGLWLRSSGAGQSRSAASAISRAAVKSHRVVSVCSGRADRAPTWRRG